MEFKKYPKILRVGHEDTQGVFDDNFYMQEKIDGGNFRFYFTNGGQIVFGSRTQQLTSNEGEETNVQKNFKKVIDYVRGQVESSNIDLSKFSNYIFYGEACFKHTINYDWEKIPLFLGFDIYNVNINEFMTPQEVKYMFELLNLEHIPFKSVDWKELEERGVGDWIVPKSEYALASAEDQQAEGVVFKNYEKQIFAKYVRDVFKERNAQSFGGTPKYNKVDDTDNAEFVFKYCTNARIEKCIMRRIDEGHKLDMPLMGKIIKDTYLDIIEEEWREILTSNWKLDFKGIRKTIAPRCRAVLENMIVNNAR